MTIDPVLQALGLTTDAQERSLDVARQRIRQLTIRYRQTAGPVDPPGPVEIVRGRAAIQARFRELYRTARTEMRGIDAPPYLADPMVDNDEELTLLGQGLRYRVLYDRRAVGLPGRTPGIERGIVVGEEARVTDVSFKLLLGEAAAMVPLHSDPVDLDAWLVIHDPVLVAALSGLFELYWERGVPLHIRQESPGRADQDDAPSETDRTLLSLLTAGHTDRTIADSLGLHERTVHRRIRAMMRRLDAPTRFQAGYQAVRRGWLTESGGSADAAR
ncbi:LuxR C-terminal-related transcriptional regulator [Kribbella sp. NPDC051952]|uniref:helix-turn-helix transcriptional regulator n=1 Tax=Kribbella sp. NPDC051952 TaxID=3154851 RepID=UPI00343E01F4